MCDSRRELSARTARRNALREDRGRASDFSRLGFAETKKGPQSSAIISHPLLGLLLTQWREFGSRGRPPKLRRPQLGRSGPARRERRRKLIHSEGLLRLLRRF